MLRPAGHALFAAAAIALTPVLAVAAAAQAADPTLEQRLESFVVGGYDALTVPVDWFAPTEAVAGRWQAPRTVAASAAIAPEALDKAAGWAAAQGSSALLVQHRGQLVYERYWQGTGRDMLFNPQSMSKTLVALLIGQAIARGELAVTDPVSRFVPQWRDDPRGAITIAQLLTMSSGLEQLGAKYGYAITAENPAAQQHFGQDFLKPVLGLTLASEPGSKWDYNNNATNLLGHILQTASRRRYADLLSSGLWQPLQLGRAKLYLDKSGGMPLVSCCVFSRPVDWLAIGQLILDAGRADGEQIVPADWIAAMITPSATYRGYGYQIWLGDQQVGGPAPDRPGLLPWQSEAFAASVIFLNGHGSQRVWIVPSHDLVIVRAGREWPAAWDESMIPNTIIRGLDVRSGD